MEQFSPVDLHQGLQCGISDSSLGVAVGGDDVGDELTDGQLGRPVGIECVLEEEEDFLSHSTVLMAEGWLDLLKERLRRDGGVHQLAEDDVGLLPHLGPAVPQPVLHGAQHRVQVRLEVRGESVNQKSDNVQTILGNLQL